MSREVELIIELSFMSACIGYIIGWWTAFRISRKIWAKAFDEFADELMAEHKKAWERALEQIRYPDKKFGDK